MTLSVVIVAYKNWELLLKTLESIEKYNDIGDELEVIVVDNSPTDCRVDKYICRDWRYNFRYLPSVNKGFGFGNNIGAANCNGKYIAFINPDIIFVENIFKKIIKGFESDNNMVIQGCRLLKMSGKANSSFKYTFCSSFIDRQKIKVLNGLGLFNDKKMYIEGADIFIRKDVFDLICGFDEKFFMYYEESDLINRVHLLNNNYYVKFRRDLHLIHMENGSTPNSEQATLHEIESCKYFASKYGLDAMKKIKSDYIYYLFKDFVYMLIKHESKYKLQIDIYKKEIQRVGK